MFLEGILAGIKKMNEIIEPIQKAVNILYNSFSKIAKEIVEWARPYKVVLLLGENQYIYWDYLDDIIMDKILNSNNINKTLREINKAKNFADIHDIILQCEKSVWIVPYKKLFKQSVKAFMNCDNELALFGFIAIIDGLLSDVSKNSTTGIFKRIDPILKKLEEREVIGNDEYAELVFLMTFRDTMESFSKNITFESKEPKNLNRHWIMHGRSRRRKTRLDCIKMIRFIYSIILLDKFSQKEVSKL